MGIKMNENSELHIVFVVTMLLGILASMLVTLCIKKKDFFSCDYDERQLLVRGKSFKYGFITLMIYFGAVFFLQVSSEQRWIEDYIVTTLGICLGILVFAGYSIWNDAYLSFKNSPGKYIVLLTAAGLINLMMTFIPTLLLGEESRLYLMNLMVGITALLLVLLFAVKRIKDSKQEEVE